MVEFAVVKTLSRELHEVSTIGLKLFHNLK